MNFLPTNISIIYTFRRIENILPLLMSLCFFGCTQNAPSIRHTQHEQNSSIVCDDRGCSGTYRGPEFVNGSDIAHQFSNKMSEKVGSQLKALYKRGRYSKVNFTAITMTTEGMGSGNVTYTLSIPFEQVDQPCKAYTSFDHVGGWNHAPALTERKKQLQSVLMKGESLNISPLKRTPEGLQEHWIQWKNKHVQGECDR